MARRTTAPTPPRDHTPDLPPRLEEHTGLAPRADVVGAQVTLDAGDTDAAHGRIAESRLAAASVGQATSGPVTSRWMGVWGIRRV